jgi:hypothetical protein
MRGGGLSVERQQLRRRFRLATGFRLLLPAALAVVVAAPAGAGPSRPLHGSISVSKTGNGSGVVVSSPAGIDCGGVCSGSFVSDESPDYKPVSLSASPDPGSVFDGWGGACSGGGGCTIDPVKMGASYAVTASFTSVRPTQLPVAVSVSGSGRVTSSPAGIDCPSICTASFATDSTVTLNVAPTPGWSFAGWSGDCSGTGTCALVMSGPRAVTATFSPPETVYALTVAVEGGTVVSDIEGISCPGSCVGSYGAGVTVTLAAQGGPAAWEGSCSGESTTCQVTMSGPRAVAAAFAGRGHTQAPLAVAVVGKGAVSSSPIGISCGAACGAVFPRGTVVDLSATPEAGWAFAGWSGTCAGVVRACRVAMRGPRVAIALFVEAGTRFPLAVTMAGRGAVRSRPAGIACSPSCSASFLAGSTVVLEAVAAEGWTFVRWSGACAGSRKVCSLGMDGPKSVSATFGRLADRAAPRVKSLPSTGAPGRTARLRYRLREESGRSREWASVFRGHKRLATVRGPLDEVEPGVLFYFLPWRVPASFPPSILRFCVWAVDPTGNRSPPSCAPLRIG